MVIEKQIFPKCLKFYQGYYYPDYCLGSCTMMTTKMAEQIYNQALRTDNGDFNMEDIFFSGIVRKNLGKGALYGAHGWLIWSKTNITFIKFY